MAALLFTCPVTRMNVQHKLDEGEHVSESEDVSETEYEVVTCPACARLHFINRKTGKLLGHDEG
jgi:hypothetical protein